MKHTFANSPFLSRASLRLSPVQQVRSMVAWGRIGAPRREVIRCLLADARLPAGQTAEEWAERCNLLRPILADADLIDAAAPSEAVLVAACQQAHDACWLLSFGMDKADILSVAAAFVDQAAEWAAASQSARIRELLGAPVPMPKPSFIEHSLRMAGTLDYRKAIALVRERAAAEIEVVGEIEA